MSEPVGFVPAIIQQGQRKADTCPASFPDVLIEELQCLDVFVDMTSTVSPAAPGADLYFDRLDEGAGIRGLQ